MTQSPEILQTFSAQSWQYQFSQTECESAAKHLEQGGILFFPNLSFALEDYGDILASDQYMQQGVKNISYNSHTDSIKGTTITNDTAANIKRCLQDFSYASEGLLQKIIPVYADNMLKGRTSFRPVEIEGRQIKSYKKDDTRLHVDAFPSSPVQGNRILRVFTNIHPGSRDRVWRTGEPFADVAQRFIPGIKPPLPGSQFLLKTCKITKSIRTPYDHYMLHMHDTMKGDMEYQQSVPATELRLPPGSTWIVYTDLVSHAALAGQHLLEQTFYLPVDAMVMPEKTPLKILEKMLKRPLV